MGAIENIEMKLEACRTMLAATRTLLAKLEQAREEAGGDDLDLGEVKNLIVLRGEAMEEVQEVDSLLEHGPKLTEAERSKAGAILAEIAKTMQECEEISKRTEARMARIKQAMADALDNGNMQRKGARAYKAAAG